MTKILLTQHLSKPDIHLFVIYNHLSTSNGFSIIVFKNLTKSVFEFLRFSQKKIRKFFHRLLKIMPADIKMRERERCIPYRSTRKSNHDATKRETKKNGKNIVRCFCELRVWYCVPYFNTMRILNHTKHHTLYPLECRV